mmetsp:Transcript_945/g.1297  ORF Transcript_945/g.1297 Transcript_945/m.1297 type:complete len:121 (+) Transcript_945:228-590(+)|eukprot:CAMPEP_0185567192 /NCGR_PEP_ID=MMETSP0434-20130131/545_1 /TAXON_ID=626734 ORGANISM="Favella taraikaensis, Strain Fe Narragansett Bay" /NCGR_SAMPLE_ID=MMETSP0434 /ASSEMBLY_ACC=CAM_ASM_000379 /LENGTH=120 /DNA_ID=CAMNT_0028181369 /DNA_START=229 /DNA_END=591 /DNA_ORIENTATION=-
MAELHRKKKEAQKKKPKSHRDPQAFNLYIHRVMKQVSAEREVQIGMSMKAMTTMNSIIADVFDNLMMESRMLVVNGKKQTLQSKDVEAAVKLLLSGELCKGAVECGRQGLKDHMGDQSEQ